MRSAPRARLEAEDVLRKKIDEPGNVLLVEIRSRVNRRQQALELRKSLFQQRENVIEPQLHVIGAGDLDDVVPARFLGDEENLLARVEVRVFQQRERKLLVSGIEVALWIGNIGIDSARRFS